MPTMKPRGQSCQRRASYGLSFLALHPSSSRCNAEFAEIDGVTIALSARRKIHD